MTQEEKTDQVLLIFYRQTKDGGMCSLSDSIGVRGETLNKKELEEVIKILATKKLVVFKIVKYGFEGRITLAGKAFVETTSFFMPETSILELTEKNK